MRVSEFDKGVWAKNKNGLPSDPTSRFCAVCPRTSSMAIYFTRERNDSDATTKCFELLQSLIEILSISLAKILAFEKYARGRGIFLKLFKSNDQNKCDENISNHLKKELPIPFFKESAAGYASWKTKKNSSMGLYEKHSLFCSGSPT
ncbi:hypothetical protein [Haliscomenobacter sp.]|uniref:hypothetical protein n=1 Tax=Haliscomenobacter sp. TaxID=2717303 RepID=UPI003364B8D3